MVAEGYKDTEIGVIPVEWKVVDFKNFFCTVGAKKYQVQKSNYLKNGSYPIIDQGQKFIVGYSDEEDKVYHNTNGVIVFGDHTRIIKFIDFDFVVGADGTQLLKSLDGINQKFSYYVLSNKELTNLGYSRHFKLVKEMKFPLPPLKEQEKIADILSTADAKIDAIASQIEKAETLKKGLLQKLLSEGIGHSEFKDSELGKIPESWEVVKLDKLIESKSIISHLDGNHGGLYPNQSEFVESGIPYLSANMIKGNNIDFSLAKFLTKERASKFRKGVAKDKDVLFAHNATVGPVTLLKTNLDYVILSTTLTYYRCDLEKLNNYYLMNYMKSLYFIHQYEKFMKQSTRNQIPITQQRQLYFIIPPLEEQKQIADILSTADEKLEVLRAKKEKYGTLKKGLLQKLLSGEVRV